MVPNGMHMQIQIILEETVCTILYSNRAVGTGYCNCMSVPYCDTVACRKRRRGLCSIRSDLDYLHPDYPFPSEPGADFG